MTTVPSSEGLRRYHELCVSPSPRECCWFERRDWVVAHVPQEQILQLNIMLWEELGPISQAKDGTPEGQLAELIRDVCDVVWYAMDKETTARFEAIILERTKAEKVTSTACGLPHS